MKLGTVVLWGPDLEGFRSLVRTAEEVGCSVIGVGDSPAAWHDLYVSLAVAATETSSAVLTPMVTTPYLRHPVVTASALSALHELTGGRTAVAIGSGGSAMGSIGRRRGAGNEDLRRYVTAVRQLLHGETPEVDGVTTARLTRGRPLPVLMGADGPKALALAGQVADGVVISAGMSLDLVDWKLDIFRRSAEAAGRDPDALSIWAQAFSSVRPTREEAAHDIMPLLASTAGMGMKAPYARARIPDELKEAFAEMERRYDPTAHVVVGGANAALLEELGLVDFMVGWRGVCGNEDTVSAHLAALSGRGISCLIAPTPGNADPVGTLQRMSSAVRRAEPAGPSGPSGPSEPSGS